MHRPVTKRERQPDGTLLIEGVLGDGLPDEDGTVLDRDWLYEAACTWLAQAPGVWTGTPGLSATVAGAGEAVWTSGPVVYMRCRIQTLPSASTLADVPELAVGLGIAKPVYD